MPRHIPERWKYSAPLSLVLGGVLPFGSIFIELYFVFTSFWNYKFYYVYGFMLLVYVILILVTMCLSVVSTYYLLNAEDYRWQWPAFGMGASTSGMVLLFGKNKGDIEYTSCTSRLSTQKVFKFFFVKIQTTPPQVTSSSTRCTTSCSRRR